MDFKTQTNHQAQPAQTPVQPAQFSADRPNATSQGNGSGHQGGYRKLLALLVSIFVLALLAVGLFMLWQSTAHKTAKDEIETDKYQAVFMTNGQVYFGHLANLEGNYTDLTDVYYLQVQQGSTQNVQPAATKSAAEQPKVSLTKLGNELHGPTDKMHIAHDQILFWENLKDDSTVVKAIKDYQAKQ